MWKPRRSHVRLLKRARYMTMSRRRRRKPAKEALDLVRSERSNATVHLLRQIGSDKCGGPVNVISRESSITIFSCSMHFDTMQT